MKMCKQQTNQKGFTLIEMAAVIGIIVLVSSVLYANYHNINKQGDAIGLNERMVNDIRKVQNNSIKRKSWEGQTPGGWGVKLDNTNDRYTIFADFDGDKELSTPVKLLVHGTEWSSGSTFTESSSSGKTVTLHGNVAQVSNAGRPANTSGYWSFDGTGDYLTAIASSDFAFGTGDFTIDFWLYPQRTDMATTGKGYWFVNQMTTDSNNRFQTLYYNDGASKTIRFNQVIAGVSSYPIISSDTTLTLDTWYHLAFVRHGNTLSIYLDGVSIASGDATGMDLPQYLDPLTIGAACWTLDNASLGTIGYIDDLRIVKGAAMWTHNFTVPNKEHVADIETVKVANLSKGVNIASLVGEAGAVDTLDVYFSPINYSTYQDGSVPNADVTIGLNDSDGITAKTITINPYGLVSSE